MSSLQKNNLNIVIDALKKSVDELKNQEKAAAINTILNISNEIQFLNSSSKELEKIYGEKQKKITDTICNIIKSEADIRNSYLNTQKSIDKLNIDISKNNVKRIELIQDFNSLQKELNEDERTLKAHEKSLNELNDSSALSILRSIFTLGLDRAIMGIKIIINNDVGRINQLKGEISKFNELLKNNMQDIQVSEALLSDLNKQKMLYEDQITRSKERENILNNEEKISRNNLTLITNVVLFYGKLSIILEQINHRIDDVIDIVAELNDNTPTIIAFNSSDNTLISLKDALLKFDEIIEINPSIQLIKLEGGN